MAEPLHVNVDDLRRAASALLDHLEAVHGDVVTVPDAAFWTVPASARNDVYRQPEELTIGQLEESWVKVLAAVADDDTTVSYALVWLADVLREIGQRTVG